MFICRWEKKQGSDLAERAGEGEYKGRWKLKGKGKELEGLGELGNEDIGGKIESGL